MHVNANHTYILSVRVENITLQAIYGIIWNHAADYDLYFLHHYKIPSQNILVIRGLLQIIISLTCYYISDFLTDYI